MVQGFAKSGRQDLNLRPLDPQTTPSDHKKPEILGVFTFYPRIVLLQSLLPNGVSSRVFAVYQESTSGESGSDPVVAPRACVRKARFALALRPQTGTSPSRAPERRLRSSDRVRECCLIAANVTVLLFFD